MMALLRNPKAAQTIRRRYAGTRVPAYRILTIWVRHFFTKQSHQVVEKIECPPIIGRNNPNSATFLWKLFVERLDGRVYVGAKGELDVDGLQSPPRQRERQLPPEPPSSTPPLTGSGFQDRKRSPASPAQPQSLTDFPV